MKDVAINALCMLGLGVWCLITGQLRESNG
jgi:hypothetical protein